MSCRRQGWRRIHLDKPGLEIGIDKDVVAVALEAVAVIDDAALDSLEGMDDDTIDVLKELCRGLAAPGGLHEEPNVLQIPFPYVRWAASDYCNLVSRTSVLDVIILIMLLDGHISEVDKGVVKLASLT